MPRRNVKLTIAYDGTAYHGWQRQQRGIVTVQGTLEDTISRVVKHPVSLRGAGRTDTGVHAAGQVASFFTDSPIPEARLHHAINCRLPGDIRVKKAEPVGDDFDAVTSAKSKLYRYAVYNDGHRPAAAANLCYHFYHQCELGPMRSAAALLLGEHDFASFASAGHDRQSTVRTLLGCEVWRKYHWVYFDLEADGFLYHMVRNIVGTLLEIGRAHWACARIKDILEARDRAAAGPMAPPQGLTLRWVRY